MKLTVLTSIFLCTTTIVFAWGPTGHRVTGWVANEHLSRKAREAVDRILEGQSIAIAGTWMDEVRSDSLYDFMEDWHWVTLPVGKKYSQVKKNPNGDIIVTLERVIRELRTGNLSVEEERTNLRILIHLVSDIHMPLHVGTRDDRGGNDVRVRWFNASSNLHRVWDSQMIDDTRLSFTELAESLRKPTAAEVREWQSASVLDWAAESQSYDKDVYDIGNGKLGYRYAYENLPIVRHRLLQSGVRLAGILNSIYGK